MRNVKILLLLAIIACSLPVQAIYQIVTCRSTYTSHDGGVNWSASETCYVSGYSGRGNWDIPNDREKPLYIEDPSHYILVDSSGAHSTSKEVAVNLCKDEVDANFRQCSRGVAIGTGVTAYICSKLGNIYATAACGIVVSFGINEGQLYCDGERTAGSRTCESMGP